MPSDRTLSVNSGNHGSLRKIDTVFMCSAEVILATPLFMLLTVMIVA